MKKKKGETQPSLPWAIQDVPDTTKEISCMFPYKEFAIILYGFYNDDENEAFAINVKENKWQTVSVIGDKSLGNHKPSICFYEENKALAFGENYRSDSKNVIRRLTIVEENDQLSLNWELLKTKGTLPNVIFSTAHVFKGFLYVIGGETREMPHKSKAISRLSLETMKWEEVNFSGAPIEGRMKHNSILYNDAIYVFFGETDSGLTKTIMKLDLSKLQCEILKTDHALLTPRRGCTDAQADSKVYFFGGEEKGRGNAFKVLGELWVYDFEKNCWDIPSTKGGPGPRRDHISCHSNGTLFVYSGLSSNNTFVSKFSIDYLRLNLDDQESLLSEEEGEKESSLVKKTIQKKAKEDTKKRGKPK